MRAFFCIPIPDVLRDSIDAIARDLRSKTTMHASWVALENYHVTLGFLGDIDASLTVPLEALCRSLCTATAPFECVLDQVGAFPDADRARVIWVGGDAPQPFRKLSSALGAGLEELGFPRARSESHVHVTLTRIKDHPDPSLSNLIIRANPIELGRLFVDRIVLMESVLTQRGAIYSPLFTVNLRQPSA
ncbi:MAG: RNA 2',3'-cyclic phosphodiesterase [Candidatus Atribacteria bacterium]|nr:MAG: RNA 2',3'-cyclic phosphodiesterase [Candidatus Atribacteria bacterium]